MRSENLSQKSYSQLLLESLLHKPSHQLYEIQSKLFKLPLEHFTLHTQAAHAFAADIQRRLRAINNDDDDNDDDDNNINNNITFISVMTREHECVIDHLLALGADVNYTDHDHNTALRLAVMYEKSEKVVVKLLKKGRDSHALQP